MNLIVSVDDSERLPENPLSPKEIEILESAGFRTRLDTEAATLDLGAVPSLKEVEALPMLYPTSPVSTPWYV